MNKNEKNMKVICHIIQSHVVNIKNDAIPDHLNAVQYVFYRPIKRAESREQ